MPLSRMNTTRGVPRDLVFRPESAYNANACQGGHVRENVYARCDSFQPGFLTGMTRKGGRLEDDFWRPSAVDVILYERDNLVLKRSDVFG